MFTTSAEPGLHLSGGDTWLALPLARSMMSASNRAGVLDEVSRPDWHTEESAMLSIRIVAMVVALLLPTSLLAQGWTEYIDRTDRFSVNFPGQPTIRDTTYPPQRGAPLEARVFTVQDGPRVYSLTVVNLSGLARPSDVKGSVAWEAWNFRKRGGEITYDAFAQVDHIDGHQLHITNPDKSLTVVGIFQHARRLVHPGGRCASRHAGRRALSTIAHHPRRGRQADPLRARRRRKPTVQNHQSRRHLLTIRRTTRSVRGIINIRAEKPTPGSPRSATALAWFHNALQSMP